MKGKKHSEEHRKKLSEARKGKPSGMLGKHHTEEAKIKISEACKKNPARYWLGKKRPDISEKAKKWAREKLNPYWKHSKGISYNTGRTWFEKDRKRTKEEIEKMKKTLKETWSERCDEIVRKRNQGGGNHWNWQGGKSYEIYPQDWNNMLKRRIMERDNFRCEKCGTNRGLLVHHIDEDKQNCNPDNLITCCRSCHSKIHRFDSHLKKDTIVFSNT